MAVTKIWTIKDSLQRVLDYAANPDKTEYDALAQTLHYAENDAKTKLNESAQLVTGIHCRVDHAWEDMRAVQERFGKTDGVVALHAYQSFREGEVTPEQCHEIGVALARRVWGKRFQVLVATHMNTDNLHNHFVINSVSYVDGKKYEQRRSQYAEFRAASDKLCREYGLSVVEQPKAKEPARYARMREAIDQACEDASTAEDFHRALYRQGYIFGSDPNRRYATIRARDGGRAVRLLKWSDINWRKRTIHVQRGVVKLSHQESITKDPKTSSGDRMVYLSKEMCQLLKAWRKECEWDRQQTANETVDEDDYLFRQPNGKPMCPSTFTYRFKLILKANNLPLDLNVHSLRHTNASLLIAQGVDVRTVASLLGHAQASTTLDIYAHAFDKNKRKAQEKLGKAIGL